MNQKLRKKTDNVPGRNNGGEYYVPRPFIRIVINVVATKMGDKIHDCASGISEIFGRSGRSVRLST